MTITGMEGDLVEALAALRLEDDPLGVEEDLLGAAAPQEAGEHETIFKAFLFFIRKSSKVFSFRYFKTHLSNGRKI